jgi:DNA-directed RNA polymerase subunit H
VLSKETVLNHSLVPKHEVLSKSAAEALLKELKVGKDHLPKIRTDDPVVKHLGAKRGDVVRVTRNSMTAGEATYYRVVA